MKLNFGFTNRPTKNITKLTKNPNKIAPNINLKYKLQIDKMHILVKIHYFNYFGAKFARFEQ
jgi:hypothetical protein